MIKKFSRLNITAPLSVTDLDKTAKELEELKEAFEEKGDIEREEAKRKFLRESRRKNYNEKD